MANALATSKLNGDARTKTILVVEDEVLVLTLIAEALRDEGYSVIETLNCAEALAVLRGSLQIDLLLTDQRIPGDMDGAALVRTVRTEFPLVKLLMTASEGPEDSIRELLDGFLAKPFVPHQLTSLVCAVVAPRLNAPVHA